jgi:hypothetical protein
VKEGEGVAKVEEGMEAEGKKQVLRLHSRYPDWQASIPTKLNNNLRRLSGG